MKGFLCEANYIQSEIWAEKIDLFKAKRGLKKVGIFFLPWRSFRDEGQNFQKLYNFVSVAFFHLTPA